jgi:hypothetical protein
VADDGLYDEAERQDKSSSFRPVSYLSGLEPNRGQIVTDRTQVAAARLECRPSSQRKVRNASNAGYQRISYVKQCA